MFYLVKTAGLESYLYVGNLVNGSREGYGVQYFANGYKFSGEWQGNRANGPGKLEYTDGTFYEGVFKDNRIIEGILSFYNGAKFVGKFNDDERHRERFQEGSFIFTNGDMLKTTWNNGIPQSGSFITKEGKIAKFIENEKAVFLDSDDSSHGKIIIANSTEIYEGGIKEKLPHGKGIIYSSFPHYEEAYYTAGKPNGPYVCNYIHGGYCYEGNFKTGQRVGKWKYQTVKGFFYDGEANLKSGKVTFPYLNDDHFVGDVDIQFHNMILINGLYNMVNGNGKINSLQIQNIKSLSEIPEVKDRKITFQDIAHRFQKSKITSDEPILNGVQIYSYPDGSYFKGNFNYDFIYIHKKELLNCYFPAPGHAKKGSRDRPNWSVAPSISFRQIKAENQLIDGVLDHIDCLIVGKSLNGQKLGYCKTISKERGMLEGVYCLGKLNGPGKKIDTQGHIFYGNFINDMLDGPATVLLENGDIVKCSFKMGKIDESKATIKKTNGLIYNGAISKFKKHGHGELIYTNGYRYEGDFLNGDLDSSIELGRITNPENQEFECIYTKVGNRNIGILETVSEGDVYVYNSTSGSLKKAQ